jgi:hypothetical protein
MAHDAGEMVATPGDRVTLQDCQLRRMDDSNVTGAARGAATAVLGGIGGTTNLTISRERVWEDR